MTLWQTHGDYEFEYDYNEKRFTGWCRCTDNKSYRWNNITGKTFNINKKAEKANEKSNT